MFVPIISPSPARLPQTPLARAVARRRPVSGPTSVNIRIHGLRHNSTTRVSSLSIPRALSFRQSYRGPRRYQSSTAKLDLSGQLSQKGRVTVITGMQCLALQALYCVGLTD